MKNMQDEGRKIIKEDPGEKKLPVGVLQTNFEGPVLIQLCTLPYIFKIFDCFSCGCG
jgi:hypothetical protein